MKLNLHKPIGSLIAIEGSIAMLLLLSNISPALAQTTVSSNPANGATGVSETAPVVFTFSAAVTPSATTVTFFSTNPPGAFPVTTAWNSGDTVLTCTPVSPFPADATIIWSVFNLSASVFASGSFSTGTNSTTGGGSGTNAITSFSVGKFYINEQLDGGPATPITNSSYSFSGNTSLASNQTASVVTLTLPTGGAPLGLNPSSQPWFYTTFASATDSNSFESTYPEGNYTFNITGTPSNVQAIVNLPANMQQPNAPHISNFTNAQNVDASKPFQLNWDAFQGGTASDIIAVALAAQFGTNIFATGNPGMPGAMNGTATSVTIPANTLAPNSIYSGLIIFYHYVVTTNAEYATFAYRATGTQFSVGTTGTASAAPPIVSNAAWSGVNFEFDVATTPNQALKVLFNTHCSLPIQQWQKIMTTNSPGNSVHIVITPQAGAAGYFRLGNGL